VITLEEIVFTLTIFALGLSFIEFIDAFKTKILQALAWLRRKKILGPTISLVAVLVFILYLMWAHDLLRVEIFEYTKKALTENWKALILSTSLLATPLILAAVGECINERAGLFNIGLEGIFFLTVVIGVRGAEIIGSGVAGLLVGLLTGALIGFIFSVLSVYVRANQLVLGMGINLFAMGMLAYLLMSIWAFPGIHSVHPRLHIPKIAGYFTPVFFVALVAAILAHILLHKTLFGIRIRAAGEKPEAVDVAGVRIDRIRILTCTVGAALCGLGGAFFSLGWFGEIVKEMAVGMGFIALACVVVAGLEPLLALAIAFIFGFVRALADWVATMPGINAVLPGAFYIMHMVPFLVTLLVVTIFIGRRRFPRALGKPYIRE